MGRKWILGLVLLAPIGAYYWLRPARVVVDAGVEKPPLETPVVRLNEDEKKLRHILGSLPILPGQGFPSLLPWGPLRLIGEDPTLSLEYRVNHRPLDFLEDCLRRYEREIQGYHLTFLKRERIEGKLQPPETVRVYFREKPFSVHMHWLKGQRKAIKSLYVEGENEGKLLAVPNVFGFAGPVVSRPVDGDDAKKSGRYGIHQFGIYLATQRVLASMRKAEDTKTLHVRYDGLVQVEQLGNRPCYKLVRTPFESPEEDGLNELTIYIDQETLLQVGTVLRDAKGDLIAEYFFCDIVVNPTFDEKQFTRQGL